MDPRDLAQPFFATTLMALRMKLRVTRDLQHYLPVAIAGINITFKLTHLFCTARPLNSLLSQVPHCSELLFRRDGSVWTHTHRSIYTTHAHNTRTHITQTPPPAPRSHRGNTLGGRLI